MLTEGKIKMDTKTLQVEAENKIIFDMELNALQEELKRLEELNSEYYWSFSRSLKQGNSSALTQMALIGIQTRKLRLIIKYYGAKNQNAEITLNNLLLLSNKLDTFEKIECMDRILFKYNGSGAKLNIF